VNKRFGPEEERILSAVYRAASSSRQQALTGIDRRTWDSLGLDSRSFNSKVEGLIETGFLRDLTGVVGLKYANVKYCSLGLTSEGKVYCEHYGLT
jgi:hypothetical protein